MKINLLKSLTITLGIMAFSGKAQLITNTYSWTGSVQTVTVPGCVSQLSIVAYGGQGANGASANPTAAIGGTGGLGAMVSGVYTFTNTGTSTLNIYVGGAGTGSVGGFNGGGSVFTSGISNHGGAGGGASDIRLNGTALANRIVVAGGGGGGGNAGCSSPTLSGGGGGFGGGGNGSNGLGALAFSVGAQGGQGAQGVTGGTFGVGCQNPSIPTASGTTGGNGTLGQGGGGGRGGDGATFCLSNKINSCGGGGGGGFMGGGGGGGGTVADYSCVVAVGGSGGGGAGGTNSLAFLTNTAVSNGVRTGNGLITISYSISNPPITSAGGATTICEGSSATVTASGASSYSWSSAQTGSAPVVSPTTTTIYTVTGSNGPGCESTATVQVSVNPRPVISVGNQTICSGNTVTLAPSGAVTYTYSNGSSTIAPTTNTSVTILGTNAFGCVSAMSATSNITVNSSPTITVNSGSICSGNNFVIVPGGAITYTIQGGTATVSPMANQTYTVSGTNAGGCVSALAATSSVTVNATPTISVNSGSICVGSNFIITPGGANTYTIQGGTATVSPVTSQSYTVTGTSTAGCVSATSATSSVNVNSNPTITVNSGSICAGANFVIMPSGASTYTIQGGTATVSPVSATSYTVRGTSSAGCISANTATSSVTVNASPTITVNSGSICTGSNFVIMPGGATTYTIQGGTATVSPMTNQTYTVSGTNASGCVSAFSATSTVTVNANPTITVNSGTICVGQTFTISPSGANTYTVQGGSNTVSPTANTSYTVSGTSTAGCVSQNAATSNVTVNANPTITVNSGSICSGQTFTISPSGANTYTVQGGNNTVSPTANTSYTVRGTSSAGCLSQNTATSNVTVNANPTITVNSGTICVGQTFTISPSGANTYTVQGGSNTVTPIIVTSYTVRGTSSAGCLSQNTATSNVTVYSNPTVTVNSGTICAGQTFTIMPSGANTYTIQGGSNTVTPTSNSSYTVTGTSIDGCVSQNAATSNVTVNPNPTVTVNSGDICDGEQFIITASGASTYSYSGGSNTVSPSSTTAYSVIGISTEGCVSAPAICNVTVNPNPTVTASSDRTLICVGESATITASGAPSYTWDPSASTSSIVVSPTVTTSYTVIGYDANFCADFAIVTLSVDACTGISKVSLSEVEAGIKVYPNPNNGEFTVELSKQGKVVVYNLFGAIVYESEVENTTHQVLLTDKANGIYFVQMKTSETSKVIRVMKN